jgi:hypothetical protein
MIYEMVNRNMRKHKDKRTEIIANLQRVGSQLGTKVMMKVSNCHSSKTRDVSQVLKLFANEFWEFIFGKKGEDIVTIPVNSITFKDKDFELITRVSGNDSRETKQFIEYLQAFCVALFESALKFLDVDAEVKMQKMERFTLLEVTCN